MTPKDAWNEPGEARAYQGRVVVDGPDGVAVTLTPSAARDMGLRLIAAAQEAEHQDGRGSPSGFDD